MTYPLCDVCGDAIEDDDPHYYHEPDCPRFFDDTSNYPCRCDLVAHGQCCPQCAAREGRISPTDAETEDGGDTLNTVEEEQQEGPKTHMRLTSLGEFCVRHGATVPFALWQKIVDGVATMLLCDSDWQVFLRELIDGSTELLESDLIYEIIGIATEGDGECPVCGAPATDEVDGPDIHLRYCATCATVVKAG